jgi:hypothetical protein
MANKHQFEKEQIPLGVAFIAQICLKCGVFSRKYRSSRTYLHPGDLFFVDTVPKCQKRNEE